MNDFQHTTPFFIHRSETSMDNSKGRTPTTPMSYGEIYPPAIDSDGRAETEDGAMKMLGAMLAVVCGVVVILFLTWATLTVIG